MSSEFAAIIEVGARDGLQNEKQFVPTEAKIRFIQLLKEAGFKEMELTSFVSPKWVPQMQDSKEIVKAFQDEMRNIVLTPNEKGIDAAKALNCEAIAIFVGVSNTFNQKNINKTTSESMDQLKPLLLKQKQDDIFMRACISTSFYCPYEGKIEEKKTLSLCEQFVEAGVDELSVADTIGMANPKEVYSLFTKLKNAFPHILLTGHFHDTRGMALANIYAALEAGIYRFDSSAGGLGGCPFAKGATGNVATEDVIFMLHQMGVKTGIDLNKVLEAVSFIEAYVSRKIESKHFNLKTLTNI